MISPSAFKPFLLVSLLLCLGTAGGVVMSEETAEGAQIAFAATTIDLGTFSEKDGKQHCTFTFTNVGTAPLVITDVVTACGCTVAKYPKKPLAMGAEGQIEVSYNGRGKMLGDFKKTITVYSNGTPSVTRLYIEGIMTE